MEFNEINLNLIHNILLYDGTLRFEFDELHHFHDCTHLIGQADKDTGHEEEHVPVVARLNGRWVGTGHVVGD